MDHVLIKVDSFYQVMKSKLVKTRGGISSYALRGTRKPIDCEIVAYNSKYG